MTPSTAPPSPTPRPAEPRRSDRLGIVLVAGCAVSLIAFCLANQALRGFVASAFRVLGRAMGS